MSKLKSARQEGKLKKQDVVEVCFNKSMHLGFSLEKLTDNSDYNFDYFKDRARDELFARKELDKLLCEISSNSWIELGRRNKKQFGGYEKIPYDECAAGIFKKTDITPDVNVWSFRFGAGEYRMLAYKLQGCNILCILGFDFHHNAYNHGS